MFTKKLNVSIYVHVLLSQIKRLSVLIWHEYMHGDVCANCITDHTLLQTMRCIS